MGEGLTQQIQKAEGLTRRNAKRKEMAEFEAAFRQREGRPPTYEEIAAHFQRSRSWVILLRKTAARDAEMQQEGVG